MKPFSLPSRLIGVLLLIGLGNTTAGASGILGGTKTLGKTEFCKTYRCKVTEKAPLPNGYSSTLYSLLPPKGSERGVEWTVYEITRNSKVIGVRWAEGFQDYFFTEETSTMASQLSKTVIGVPLPRSAGETLINNALSQKPDPGKSKFTVGNLLAEGFLGGLANAHQFNLVLTSRSEHAGLRKVDPQRNWMTDEEQKAALRRIVAALNVFSRAAPDCPGTDKIAIPVGDGVTWESVAAKLKQIGFEHGPGFFVSSPYVTSRLFVFDHKNGRELCLGF